MAKRNWTWTNPSQRSHSKNLWLGFYKIILTVIVKISNVMVGMVDPSI